jgi:tRNA threonylcarbamoyl adenosine modification protein YeaZ
MGRVIVLAVDTSSAAVSAAVASVERSVGDTSGNVRVVAERQTIDARAHAELLTPSITACLSEAGVTVADVAAVVAGVGPGPFTGLRVGLVTATAFADARGIPTYGVCSLDAIARAVDARAVLVATDARRHEVYWARYCDGRRVTGPAVCRPADVPRCESEVIAGAGARRYPDVFSAPLPGSEYPAMAALVRAAGDRIAAGAPSERLTPLYLRRPDAVEPAARKAVTP